MTVGITWDNFIINNNDSRGVQSKFEDLCRQLFVNLFLSVNKSISFLHGNPNNPGLEAEPVFDEKNKRWIGFQAKFFENAVSYSQIYHSAEKIVEFYSGKVDVVYLFCNKSITSNAKGLVNTISFLKSSKIDLKLITDDAILDLIRSKYTYLSSYYFGNHSLDLDWFRKHSGYMFDDLGERYNSDFNVDTPVYDELSLFVRDQQAANYLNSKKQLLLKKASEFYWKYGVDSEYLNSLKSITFSIPDVNEDNLCESEIWKESLLESLNPHLNILLKKRSELYKDLEKLHLILESSDSISKEECKKTQNKSSDIEREIHDIDIITDLPSVISISDKEKQLLHKDVLFVIGKGGSGKSQLLAWKTKSLLDESRAALFLVAGDYFSNLPIQEQIMSNLGLDFSFFELVDILETIGEKENRVVPIFIDAANETWNCSLWKTGLPAIIDKIRHSPLVRLVVSFRPEYESVILSDGLKKERQCGDIVTTVHNGFEKNSIQAIREFLNHYNIPFTPVEFFGSELTNPLFLTLYCRTYNGEEVSLPKLYERLIDNANKKVVTAPNLRAIGYSGVEEVVRPFFMQMAYYMVQSGHRSVTREELASFSFWKEFNIAIPPFVHQLEKEGLLHNYVNDEMEYYFFAYDQMNDYYCAKAILNAYNTREQVRDYLENRILEVENGTLNRYIDIDLFVNSCALYVEKYGEECIDIIDRITDENDKWQVFSRYVESFQWRDASFISKELFVSLIRKYHCAVDDLWKMLIGNSVKTQNPLNADFLHSFLMGYSLNKRDYLWTIYVNRLTWNEDDRVVQLIKMFDEGDTLCFSSEKQIELLLTLFGWILTSSDRWLRDVTSKAMIELLKDNFKLCLVLLDKFNNVDDPYVIQRLYGIVFGACCKRRNDKPNEFLILTEFVYKTIFAKKEVYPDILLRDYAREIIELFLHENPEYQGMIEREVITPPYKSKPIPHIKDYRFQDYNTYGVGISHIIHSMRFEGMGYYGDFGRYIFQSALFGFKVDKYKIFNYAVYYILNKLGYKNEYFNEHDNRLTGYDRGVTAKCERIGKKYQWIAMFNILARVSDYCPTRESGFGFRSDVENIYEGPWDLFIRDFDPTLNRFFMDNNDAPRFAILDSFIRKSQEDNKCLPYEDERTWRNWVSTKSFFLNHVKDTFLLADNRGRQWVCLSNYYTTGQREKVETWIMSYALFVSQEQEKKLKETIENGDSILANGVTNNVQTYHVFNREFPWAASCREVKDNERVELWIRTGETEDYKENDCYKIDPEIIKLLVEMLNNNIFENSEISETTNSNKEDILESLIQPIQTQRKRVIEQSIGEVLHASVELTWSAQYDASKEEDSIRVGVPCSELIETMGLKQKEKDGYFFDNGGSLVAFDTSFTQGFQGVVIRKDILDYFISQKGYRLVWISQIEKDIHARGFGIDCYGEWEALYLYTGEEIKEIIRFRQIVGGPKETDSKNCVEDEFKQAQEIIDNHPILMKSPRDLMDSIAIERYLKDWDKVEQDIWRDYYNDEL